MKAPNVAILLATYNGEKFLEAQLDSLLAQDYKGDIRIFAHDDHSTDKTPKILKEYAKKYPKKFELMDNVTFGRLGPKGNFFEIMMRLLGTKYFADNDVEWLFFCDQDDVWDPSKIRKLVEAGRDIKGPGLVYCDAKIVDENLKIIEPSFQKFHGTDKIEKSWKFYLQRNNIAGCMCAINWDLFRHGMGVSVYNYDMDNIVMHDYFFSMLASLIGEIRYVDEPLVLYRQHGNNQVGAEVSEKKWVSQSLKDAGKLLGELLKVYDFQNLLRPDVAENYDLLKKMVTLYKKPAPVRAKFLSDHGMNFYTDKKSRLRYTAANLLK